MINFRLVSLLKPAQIASAAAIGSSHRAVLRAVRQLGAAATLKGQSLVMSCRFLGLSAPEF